MTGLMRPAPAHVEPKRNRQGVPVLDDPRNGRKPSKCDCKMAPSVETVRDKWTGELVSVDYMVCVICGRRVRCWTR